MAGFPSTSSLEKPLISANDLFTYCMREREEGGRERGREGGREGGRERGREGGGEAKTCYIHVSTTKHIFIANNVTKSVHSDHSVQM